MPKLRSNTTSHILECENCRGDVVYITHYRPVSGAIVGTAGAATTGFVGAAIGSVIPVFGTIIGGVVGAMVGGMGAASKVVTAGGGGVCRDCGAKYERGAINLMREKPVYTMPGTSTQKPATRPLQAPSARPLPLTSDLINETKARAAIAATQKAIARRKAVIAFGYIVAAFCLWQVGALTGRTLPPWAFWTFAVIIVILAAACPRLGAGWNPRTALMACLLLACGSASMGRGADIAHQKLHDENVARAAAIAAARQKEAMRNHERRLAWNLAHPAEVARRKSEEQNERRAHELAARDLAEKREASRVAMQNQAIQNLARINRDIAIQLDTDTYDKAVLTTSSNIDWYVNDVGRVAGSIDDQIMTNRYRKAFLRMIQRDNPGLTITHQRLLNAVTGELLNGAGADEDITVGP